MQTRVKGVKGKKKKNLLIPSDSSTCRNKGCPERFSEFFCHKLQLTVVEERARKDNGEEKGVTPEDINS